MGEILFICTGNYYRSRLAEILFNHYAREEQLAYKAFSKGLEAYIKRNTGPISLHTLSYLDAANIPWPEVIREPVQLKEEDFKKYRALIFMDEQEHKPMLEHYFPGYSEQVHFWKIKDVQFENPADVLPDLAQKVLALVKDLKAHSEVALLETSFIPSVAEHINQVKHY